MRLADCYRLLELGPSASLDEARRAHRDLTKVWHPDRFVNDDALRLKAEEKLKAINEAWATIRDAHAGEDDGPRDARNAWHVRAGGRELRFRDLDDVAELVERGTLNDDSELLDPVTGHWVPLATIPRLRDSLARVRTRRNRRWAFTLGSLALFILFRRPTPGGLLIALALGGVALVLMYRARTRE